MVENNKTKGFYNILERNICVLFVIINTVYHVILGEYLVNVSASLDGNLNSPHSFSHCRRLF